MFGTIKGRIAVIVVILAIAIGALVTKKVTYGLDLQGGMYLALEVADPEGTMALDVKKQNIEQNLEILRNRLDEFGVAEPSIQRVGDERIVVQLPGVKDEERAEAVIARQAFLEWKLVLPAEQILDMLPRIDRAVVAALPAEERAAMARDTATGGSVRDLLFSRDSAARPAGDSVAADSGAAAAEAEDRSGGATPFSSLLLRGGDGEFLVEAANVERMERYLKLPAVKSLLPRGVELKWGAREEAQGASLYRSLFVLEREPFITGEQLEDAQAGRDPQYNKTVVTFQLNRRGGRVFEQVTSANINKRIAIVLDNQVHSAPVVISQIGSNGQIDMAQAPMEEARDLAVVLRAGAFTAPLQIVEKRSIGPTLGADSVRQGKIAGLVGVSLVLLMLIGYYRVSGLLASLALAVYSIVVLGGMAAIGATLTAPGIAGFILSIGMAVDANVLIFERTREELQAGHSARLAVDSGFKNAMSAIVDSNLTTLITALILYKVGTGPVQGFAVTLSIGIIASFFSAVFVTRTLFLIYLERRRPSEPISI